jgi:hypothetical protein
VGARVFGVGDTPDSALPAFVRAALADHLQVPGALDEEDVFRRVMAWARGKSIDRVETNWEPLTVLAARLREAMGVPGMSVDTVMGFRDKPIMRQRVASAGLRVPKSARVRSRDDVWNAAREVGFPLILKPVAGAGSADTFRVDSPEDLDRTLSRLGHLQEASCEEFVDGEEFTYETVCIDGKPAYESVSYYLPNALVARQNEWISPIIMTVRDHADPRIQGGLSLGRAVLHALGMGTGFTHMEWYRKPWGEAVFGEIACRSPGANMVDLMNYAGDIDLYREWARAVCWGRFVAPSAQRHNAAIVFKRAQGSGTIVGTSGLDAFRARYGRFIAREDFLPIGSPRRDWRQTFLSDGNLVIRHPDWETALQMAKDAAGSIALYASPGGRR